MDDDDHVGDDLATAVIEEVKAFGDNVKQLRDRMDSGDASIKRRLDEIEKKVNRARLGGGGLPSNHDELAELEAKAFTTFLRKGREALDSNEVKSLRVSDDTAGGYIAPPEFSREIDRNITQFSPIRQAARVGATSSGSVSIPRRTGAPTARWVTENETRTETSSSYGQITIPVSEAAAYIDISNTLLEDAAVDIAAEVSFDLSEEFGRIEGAAFVNGTGVKQPLGILADTAVASIVSGNVSAITADSLIDVFYGLAPFYRQRGAWLLNGKTLAAIRKLKDGAGQYLWQPGLAAGQPETILGRPAIEAVDMPDIATNAYPAAFGDFASGYRVYDRVALSLLRDPFSQAVNGSTRFHARRRVGGAVVRAEAIVKLKIAAS